MDNNCICFSGDIKFVVNNKINWFNCISLDNPKYYNLLFVILLFVKSKCKKVNLTSLDKPNPNYLAPIPPICYYF